MERLAPRKDPIMNDQSSKKNTLIGFALGVTLATTIGATLKHRNEVGRFQMKTSPNEAYIVDTITGQVWTTSDSYKMFREPKAE